MSTSDWATTKLAARLHELESHTVDGAQAWALTQRHLPQVQTILAKAATSPKDFTLHDEAHAFRVAEWMARIIPDPTFQLLSSYELMLLLLSAYLHDIGMTPEQLQISRHLRHILFPKDVSHPNDWLNEGEASALQTWLDSEGRGLVAPITSGEATDHDLRLAHELLTFYARHRHNDWSAEYINHVFGKETLPHYDSWVADLVTVCRSHHDGFDELSSPRFDPKPAGSSQGTVHMRYLACVLRIADILDVDPERTPEVIFRHRSIAPGSELHWRKGHVTWLRLDAAHKQLSLVARPDRAVLEKAIRDTADAIGVELQLCARIALEKPFEHCVFAAEPLKQYVWSLPAWLNIDVHAENKEYVYIDGAFRPNTERLLKLFGGTALYGNELDSVRELLQNAFDAVREAIAYERLSDADLLPHLGQLLAAKHQVQLRLEADGPVPYLVCTDTGVGMTRTIIADHMLVSGTSVRPEILELERKCLNAGFPLERTGRFGVGVLAYFMIADQITVTTRRHQLAPDDEGHAWRFESYGVGSFGELRTHDRKMPGTEVRLTLRPQVVGDAVEWFASLREYLIDNLLYLPCRFQLHTTLPNAEILTLDPGWARNWTEAIRDSLDEGLPTRSEQEELLSNATVRLRETKQQQVDMGLQAATRCIARLTTEGELPNGYGRYRMFLPYFTSVAGASVAFFNISTIDDHTRVTPLGDYTCLLPQPLLSVGWRGIATSGFGDKLHRAIVELDLTNVAVGELKIDRSRISPTETVEREVMQFLRTKQAALIQRFLDDNGDSCFSTVNQLMLGVNRVENKPFWLETRITDTNDPQHFWSKVIFPATDVRELDHRWIYPRPNRVYWGLKNVTILPELTAAKQFGSDTLTFAGISSVPNLLSVEGAVATIPVWILESFQNVPNIGTLRFGKYAPNSPVVFSDSYYQGIRFWNIDHPIASHLDAGTHKWAISQFAKTLSPAKHREEILSDGEHAVAWMVRLLSSRDGPFDHGRTRAKDLWTALVEREREFLERLWLRLFGPQKDVAGAVKPLVSSFVGEVDVVTPSGWKTLSVYKDAGEIKKLIPAPPADWICTRGR